MNYKIKVTPTESEELQKTLFKTSKVYWKGWGNSLQSVEYIHAPYLYIIDNILMYGKTESSFSLQPQEKINAQALIFLLNLNNSKDVK